MKHKPDIAFSIMVTLLAVYLLYLATDGLRKSEISLAGIPGRHVIDISILHADTLPDFTQFDDIETKKIYFFEFIYRNSVIANRKVDAVHAEISRFDPEELTPSQSVRMLELAERYRITTTDMSAADTLRELELRAQPVPPSLVIAQAANESAWGTSRFAREAYNLFGQWCHSKGCGIVPQKRKSGATHEVRRFDSPAKSVEAYIHNINSNAAYEKLRELRASEPGATGLVLADGLIKYSERGMAYVREIKQFIIKNNLIEYDVLNNVAR